jgi:hypothetical protein
VWGDALFAAEGGIMTYASDPLAAIEGAGAYVGRILNGARIDILPLQLPPRAVWWSTSGLRRRRAWWCPPRSWRGPTR